MAQDGYFQYCEKLLQDWRESNIKLTEGLDTVFQLDHLPEPYLRFGDPSRTLILLTTNPGPGMPHQHRDEILAGTSPVSATAPYGSIAAALGGWYWANLKGTPSRRIGAMLLLARSSGYTGILQVEALPFHAAKVLKKPLMMKKVRVDPVLENYVGHLRDFLRERPVIALAAVGTEESPGLDTIAKTPWLAWQADLMGFDLRGAIVEPILQHDEKTSCVLVTEKGIGMPKGFVLMMGGSHFPGPEGLERIAEVLRRP